MFTLISIIIGTYLVSSSIYMLFFALAGKLKTNSSSVSKVEAKNKYAVFIPAYKEDAVIVEVAKQALTQDYPFYDVIVIADSLQSSTLEQLKTLAIKVVEVTFEQSTKAKALNQAMQVLEEAYDVALVLDADNVMQADFIYQLETRFQQGAQVVQGQRVAKNSKASFAVLDAVSEAINNNIYNQGPVNVGLSARLVGSAMAFDYELFKSVMQSVNAIGGFDKELEIKLLLQGKYLAYAAEAIVLDEKVRKAAVFQKQRTRWVAAQFHYLFHYGGRAFAELVQKGNVDLFSKMIQMALPPRLLLTGVLFVGTLLHFVLLPAVAGLWAVGLLCNVLANVLSIPSQYYNLKTIKAILVLPYAFFLMVMAMTKMKGANKQFIHTPHQ